MKVKSFVLVVIQFSCIAYLLLSGSVIAEGYILLGTELLGVAIGMAAIYTMRLSKLRIQPDVHPGAILIQKGIYKVVRHPMYLAILLTLIPLLITHFTVYRLLIYLVLLGNLVVKINYEEKLLQRHFPEYQKVNSKIKRLLPFVW